MSDYKDKVTKGPWEVDLPHVADVRGPSGDVCVAIYRGMSPFRLSGDEVTIGAASLDEAKANARLIAEAGTVLHETGLTPRELAEQRAELLGLLGAARCPDCDGSGAVVNVETGCCGHPTPSGECCGNAIPVQSLAQCRWCDERAALDACGVKP